MDSPGREYDIDFRYLHHPGNYKLCIEKNEDHYNGVSTADRVKIQRHILEMELLQAPHKLLAADVNRSGTITGADLSEIKRIIFGIKDTFSWVPSWIFVPSDSLKQNNKMPDINQFIPSCYDIRIIDASPPVLHFTGIKMGDVTGNAKGHN